MECSIKSHCSLLIGSQCVSVLCRFALGDARRPLHETAALVEDIVHTQLINLVWRPWLYPPPPHTHTRTHARGARANAHTSKYERRPDRATNLDRAPGCDVTHWLATGLLKAFFGSAIVHFGARGCAVGPLMVGDVSQIGQERQNKCLKNQGFSD